MNWLKFEVKLMFAGKAARYSIALLLASAIIAIHLGGKSYQTIVEKQAFSQALFESQLADYQAQETPPSAGHLGYYLYGATQWKVNPWSLLFIGQSHSAHSDLPIRALALQGQIYAQEIINPSQYKAGRLDLGFVLIYLFPLVLGVLTVTILSEEQQANRWRMYCALAKGGARYVWRKIALCTLLIILLAIFTVSGAAIWLGLNFDSNFAFVVLATSGYLLFWALIAGVIVTLKRHSAFNVLSYVVVWLLFSVLIPASVQLYLDNRFDERPAVSATLAQRMTMTDGWDKAPSQALEQFAVAYPEYKNVELPERTGSWPWYYAQQHVSDLSVEQDWQMHKLQEKHKLDTLEGMRWLSPSLLLQLAFNHLAGSSGQSHFVYIQDVANYHSEIREYLYQYLYQPKQITADSLTQFPRFQPAPYREKDWLGLISLASIIGLLIVFFRYRCKQLEQLDG